VCIDIYQSVLERNKKSSCRADQNTIAPEERRSQERASAEGAFYHTQTTQRRIKRKKDLSVFEWHAVRDKRRGRRCANVFLSRSIRSILLNSFFLIDADLG